MYNITFLAIYLAKFQSITNIISHPFFIFISENLWPPLLDLVPRLGCKLEKMTSYAIPCQIGSYFLSYINGSYKMGPCTELKNKTKQNKTKTKIKGMTRFLACTSVRRCFI